MIEELKDLNPSQLKAVKDVSNPCRIIAGPGSGKTRVITLKYLYLIMEEKIPVGNILMLTFSNRATEEMSERVWDFFQKYGLAKAFIDSHISTIHAFCLSVLEEYASYLKNHFTATTVLTDISQGSFILTFSEDFGFYSKASSVKPIYEKIIPFINTVTDEGLTHDEIYDHLMSIIGSLFKKYKKKNDNTELEKDLKRAKDLIIWNSLLDIYEQKMSDHGYIDYSHMQYNLYRELQDNTSLLKILRNRYKYILVDEYQDISYLQNEIILMLAKPQYKITIVGDDDQSIYRFRGATVKNFLDFSKNAKGTVDYCLEINYRSTPKIHTICQNLIKNNQIRIAKNTVTDKTEGVDNLLLAFHTHEDESKALIKFILELEKQQCINSHSDIAILFRSVTFESGQLVQELRRNKIPYQVYGIDKVRTSLLLEDFLNIWELIACNRDNLTEILDNIFFELTDNEKEKIRKIEKKGVKVENIPKYIKGKTQGLKYLLYLIEVRSRISEFKSNIDIFYELILNTPKIIKIIKNESWGQLEEISYLSQVVSEFDSTYKRTDPFLLSILLRTVIVRGDEIYEPEKTKGKVNILTLHQAKGLEFPIVFMPNLYHKKYKRSPFALLYDLFHYEVADEKNIDEMDQRKLFYVGMSRAKKMVVLSHPNKIQQKTRLINCRPCSYIEETDLQYQPSLPTTCIISQLQTHETRVADKKQAIDKLMLSFSRMQTYMECPRRYHYMYNLNFATVMLGYFYFGQSLHSTLEAMHKILKEDPSLTFSCDHIREILDSKWVEISYRKTDTEKLKTTAVDYLWNYFLSNQEWFSKIREIEFKFQQNYDESTVFTGKVDLIVDNDGIEIVDFKTDEIELPKYELQTYFYNYALKKSTSMNPTKVTLYSLKQNRKTTTKIDHSKMSKYANLIREAVDNIKNEQFPQNKGEFCKDCPYNAFCSL